MAIFRCNKCGFLTEVAQEGIGSSMACPKCAHPAPIYDTALFIAKVLEKFFAQQTELARLRQATQADEIQPSAATGPAAGDIDLHNTASLMTEIQHGPILEWFRHRHVDVRTNPKSVDTTGFFDEIAVALGRNHDLLQDVLDRVRYAQIKGYTSTTIHLERKTENDARAVSDFCRKLYDYSFVAKCFHLKQEKLIRLVLQTAPAIRDFFSGDWLEWYVFMTTLEQLRVRRRRYSCARNLSVTFQNGDAHELDVFFLVDGDRPLCIECKSGEFRQDIDRLLTLRKRLAIGRDHFIVCAIGLTPEQAQGLTSMYDMTFTNESDLVVRLDRLF